MSNPPKWPDALVRLREEEGPHTAPHDLRHLSAMDADELRDYWVNWGLGGSLPVPSDPDLVDADLSDDNRARMDFIRAGRVVYDELTERRMRRDRHDRIQ